MVGAGSASTARVALVKAGLILAASPAVAAGIVWKLTHPHLPLFDSIWA